MNLTISAHKSKEYFRNSANRLTLKWLLWFGKIKGLSCTCDKNKGMDQALSKKCRSKILQCKTNVKSAFLNIRIINVLWLPMMWALLLNKCFVYLKHLPMTSDAYVHFCSTVILLHRSHTEFLVINRLLLSFVYDTLLTWYCLVIKLFYTKNSSDFYLFLCQNT